MVSSWKVKLNSAAFVRNGEIWSSEPPRVDSIYLVHSRLFKYIYDRSNERRASPTITNALSFSPTFLVYIIPETFFFEGGNFYRLAHNWGL